METFIIKYRMEGDDKPLYWTCQADTREVALADMLACFKAQPAFYEFMPVDQARVE